MKKGFYSSEEYKIKQSNLTARNWEKGVFDFHKKKIKKYCGNKKCNKIFYTIPSNPKIFCSHSCSAKINNHCRTVSDATRKKISSTLKGKEVWSRFHYPKGTILVPRDRRTCGNPECRKEFFVERWRPKKFCGRTCSIKFTGSKPTSPRAARAKAGTRKDLGNFYFYSRWEANFARVLNFLNIEWKFQPKTFDLRGKKYTPDFYLPEYGLYIEIKNYLSEFSEERDRRFRKIYPEENLSLLLKKDYIKMQEVFAPRIIEWEYS